MHGLGSLFPKELARRGLTKVVLAAQVVDFWPKALAEIYPKAIPYTQALTFKDQVLTVKCTHSAVSSELQVYKEALLKAYQTAFPRTMIHFRFQTGAKVSRE